MQLSQICHNQMSALLRIASFMNMESKLRLQKDMLYVTFSHVLSYCSRPVLLVSSMSRHICRDRHRTCMKRKDNTFSIGIL